MAAHHVAKLMVTAEQQTNPAKKKKATEQAVDTILRIWGQRDHLPGNANPFAPYRNILQILSALIPARNPWSGHIPNHPITDLYRRFLRLIQTLLVLQLPRSGKGSREARKVVHKFLEDDESRLLQMLQVRIRILGIDDEKKDAEPEDDFVRVERLAVKLIKETIEDLNKIRNSSIKKLPKSDA